MACFLRKRRDRLNPHFSPVVCCDGGYARRYCVALRRPPRRTVQVRLRRPLSCALSLRHLHRFATTTGWSRDVARWFRASLSVADAFVRRCLTNSTMLRFHIPLIEPDGPFSGIRLSDKASRFRPWKVASSPFKANQSQRIVKILVWIVHHTRSSLTLMFAAQPPTQPISSVLVHGSIGT